MENIKIHRAARKLSSQFSTSKNHEGERIYHADGQANDIVRAATEGMFPQDTVFEWVAEALDAIAEACEYDRDLEDDVMYEFADNTDVYSHDLSKWVDEHSNNRGRVDEAIRNAEYDTSLGLDGAIMRAQYDARYELYQTVLNEVREREDDYPDAHLELSSEDADFDEIAGYFGFEGEHEYISPRQVYVWGEPSDIEDMVSGVPAKFDDGRTVKVTKYEEVA